jgi:hypothetical protein
LDRSVTVAGNLRPRATREFGGPALVNVRRLRATVRLARLLRESGAGDVTRTRDLLITNQLLYQLSYAGQAGNKHSTTAVRLRPESLSKLCPYLTTDQIAQAC